MGSKQTEASKSTCLVVEDDARLCSALASALSSRGFTVDEAGSVKDALEKLARSTPDLLLLDVALPDGRAIDVLSAVAQLSPTPRIIAMSGAAGPDESFALAERGVRAYLSKPINLAELEAAVDRVSSEPPDLIPALKSSVGLVPIKRIEQTVRDTMVKEALARGGGSRRAAARVLSISRQLLQHILRKG
jgi:DNA-binding NtrC family response regulator